MVRYGLLAALLVIWFAGSPSSTKLGFNRTTGWFDVLESYRPDGGFGGMFGGEPIEHDAGIVDTYWQEEQALAPSQGCQSNCSSKTADGAKWGKEYFQPDGKTGPADVTGYPKDVGGYTAEVWYDAGYETGGYNGEWGGPIFAEAKTNAARYKSYGVTSEPLSETKDGWKTDYFTYDTFTPDRTPNSVFEYIENLGGGHGERDDTLFAWYDYLLAAVALAVLFWQHLSLGVKEAWITAVECFASHLTLFDEERAAGANFGVLAHRAIKLVAAPVGSFLWALTGLPVSKLGF